MKVLIVRDRPSAGGGIVSYYDALNDYFSVEVAYTPVGRPHAMYAKERISFLSKVTLIRLLVDYCNLLYRIMVFRPDAVLINSSIDIGGTAIARDGVNIILSKILRCKTILFWHGFLSGGAEFPFAGGNHGLMHRFYRWCDAFVVLAARFKEDLRRWGFRQPVFVETTTIGRELIVNGEIRQREVPENKWSLLFLSRVIKEKGIVELIDAHKLLREEHPNLELFIAGDGEDLGFVKDYVQTEGIAGVHFLGYVTGDDKLRAFEKAAIFCFPSYAGEGMPVAVLEAMALGLPLVSSSVSGLNDILEDGKNGMILGEIAAAEIARRISELVQNDELRERISEHNRRYAADRFHPGKCARRLEAICKTVMANSR